MTEIISLADTIELVTSRDDRFIVLQDTAVIQGLDRRQFADSLIRHQCEDPMILLDTFESVAQHGYRVTCERLFIDMDTVYYRLRRLESLIGERLYHYGLTEAGNTLLDKLLQMS